MRRMACARMLAGLALGVGLFAGQSAMAEPPFRTSPQSDAAAVRERQRLALTDLQETPFRSRICERDVTVRNCMLASLAGSLASFTLGSASAPTGAKAVNQELRQTLAALTKLQRTSWTPGGEGYDDAGRLANGRRVHQKDSFPFVYAGVLYRLTRGFGAEGVRGRGELERDNEDAIVGMFRWWAHANCRLQDAEITLNWRIWSSENHDAMRNGACWGAADVLRRNPETDHDRYDDGATAERQYGAWTSYIVSYIKGRGRYGVPLEFFSPTYAKYSLFDMYGYVDYSDDAELKRVSHGFLDLWWALWAQEQIAGEHGGAKARVYADTLEGGVSAMQGAEWLYLGQGDAEDITKSPALMGPLTSSYVPPAVVVDIATDARNRGAYETSTRAPAHVLGGKRDGSVEIDPTVGGLVRRTFSAPGFVMGMPMTEARPFGYWVTSSSQNRWAGVTLSDGPEARIVPTVSDGDKANYNAIWGLQSGPTQIVQRLDPPYSRGAGPMRVWFGAPLRPVKRDGWLFVEGSAYVAVRPAWGGMRWDETKPGWMEPEDPAAPVVIHAAARLDYASLADFEDAVSKARLEVWKGAVAFTPPGGCELALFPPGDRTPEVDGVPVDFSPALTYSGPFAAGRFGDGRVTVRKGDRTLDLDFR